MIHAGTNILADVAALDAQLAPVGLYGADKGVLFTKVIYPYFKAHGYRVASFSDTGKFAYLEPKGGGDALRIELVVVSKIKVRLFGNRFAIDPKVDHGDRWDQKRVEKQISTMWGSSRYGHCTYLVLLGYDLHPEPFASELRGLADSIDWTKRGALYETSIWKDPHQRAFYTRACFWTAPTEANQALVPTPMSVTSPAEQARVPATGAAHL